MSPISRGFLGHRREGVDPSRVPPGQHVTSRFPVLSAGPTPHTPLDKWRFTVDGEVVEGVSWSSDEFRALAPETITVDIHCVTKWSKLDTELEGRLGRHAPRRRGHETEYVTAWSDGGYTTNLMLEDITGGRASGRV